MSLPNTIQLVYLGSYLDVKYVGAPTLSVGGVGYSVGNVLEPDGTPIAAASQFTVATTGGGGSVASVTVTAVEPYTPSPTLPNGMTGGGGAGVIASNFVLTTPVVYVRCPTAAAGISATFTEISGCYWGCSSLGQGLSFKVEPPFFPTSSGTMFIKLVHDSGPSGGSPGMDFTVTCYIDDAAITLFSGVFTGSVPALDLMDGANRVLGSNYCVMFSINTTTQAFDIWINDTQLTLSSGGWSSAGTFPNPNSKWSFYSENSGFVETGNLWLSISDVDWTDTANRRQFINADLSAVTLPSDGEVTFTGPGSVFPEIFLHAADPGPAQDFVANNGTSGVAWDVYDQTDTASPSIVPLEYYADDCLSIIPPVVVAVLSMDNVVVQSLATEGPCMAARFSVAPTVGPNIGLEWSDTRGISFGNPVAQIYDPSDYAQLQWNRTGYARDRVFRLFWSMGFKTALNGAFVEVAPLKT